MTTRYFIASIALALLLASPATAEFQNLDFEATLLDVESLPPSPGDLFGLPDIFNPAIVTPGWSYQAETSDRTVLPTYPVHGAMIDGHIGISTQVVMTVNGRHGDQSSLQGEHSLWLNADLDAYSQLSYDIMSVAFQTGIVPSNTKSVLIQVTTPILEISGKAEHFSVRFEGHEVEMHPVGGNTYAGNIEPIAGMQREMAIRPERYLTSPQSLVTPSIVFDDIRFSTSSAPGPPIAVPEPSALTLVVLGLLGTTTKRRANN